MRKFQPFLVLLTMLVAGPAFAVDANLNFTGTISGPSCTIDTSSRDQTVTLVSTPISDFTSIGSTASPKAVNVKLIDCTEGTDVTMTVSGTATTVPSVLKSTGSAAQVGVQILHASNVGATTGTPIVLESGLDLGMADDTGKMTIPLVVQYYALGTLTAGDVAATATLNFTYN
jgi:major type 1 subunit fimbrin (pilin)